MQVFIGPYPRNRWISHVSSTYGKDKSRFWDFVEDVLQFIYNWTINLYLDRVTTEQTVRVKIDPYDTWSMDYTLAYIIVPMLKQLRETKQGSPYVDDKDVPEKLRSNPVNTWEDENVHVKWNYVLDHMIWAFEEYTKDDREERFYSGETDFVLVKDEDGETSKLKYGPNHTFVIDMEGWKKNEDSIQEGLRLFGKYYSNLWD